jgi:hypothetical protein
MVKTEKRNNSTNNNLVHSVVRFWLKWIWCDPTRLRRENAVANGNDCCSRGRILCHWIWTLVVVCILNDENALYVFVVLCRWVEGMNVKMGVKRLTDVRFVGGLVHDVDRWFAGCWEKGGEVEWEWPFILNNYQILKLLNSLQF